MKRVRSETTISSGNSLVHVTGTSSQTPDAAEQHLHRLHDNIKKTYYSRWRREKSKSRPTYRYIRSKTPVNGGQISIQFKYKVSTTKIQAGTKYSIDDLICDVIS